MNVREVLEKLRVTWNPKDDWDILSYLAPAIEKALRAAHREGYSCGHTDAMGIGSCEDESDRGVTAGIKAMVEES